jgi:hypothetical protein
VNQISIVKQEISAGSSMVTMINCASKSIMLLLVLNSFGTVPYTQTLTKNQYYSMVNIANPGMQ